MRVNARAWILWSALAAGVAAIAIACGGDDAEQITYVPDTPTPQRPSAEHIAELFVTSSQEGCGRPGGSSTATAPGAPLVFDEFDHVVAAFKLDPPANVGGEFTERLTLEGREVRAEKGRYRAYADGSASLFDIRPWNPQSAWLRSGILDPGSRTLQRGNYEFTLTLANGESKSTKFTVGPEAGLTGKPSFRQVGVMFNWDSCGAAPAGLQPEGSVLTRPPGASRLHVVFDISPGLRLLLSQQWKRNGQVVEKGLSVGRSYYVAQPDAWNSVWLDNPEPGDYEVTLTISISQVSKVVRFTIR